MLGVNSVLDIYTLVRNDAAASLVPLLFSALVFGLFLGPAGLLVEGFFLGSFGRWVGGVADDADVRTALMWAAVPKLVGMLFWIPQMVLFGGDLFSKAPPQLEANPALVFVLYGFPLLGFVLAGWQVVLILLTLSEVHRISVWRTFPMVVIAGFLPLPFMFCATLLLGI